MQKLYTQNINDWKTATKTANLNFKHSSSLADKEIVSKILIDTLEGKERLGLDSIVCVGPAGDIWQQTSSKFFKKYDVVGVDPDGWFIGKPKPDNAVNCYQVNNVSEFYIEGQWGENIEGVGVNIQRGSAGDYICQNQTDKTDVWIVRQSLFNNTYEIKS